MSLRNLCVGLMVLVGAHALAADVALVMSVQGKVMRHDGANTVPLEAFIKLGEGDRLSLEKDAQLRVAYFENGRHETWTGPGGLELASLGGQPLRMTAPEVKTLPLPVARQLARTPATDRGGRKAPARTRAVQAPDAMARLEATYQELRSRAGSDDLEPETYLLSGLFELRELDRVEKLLGELKQDRPKNVEAALLISLYRKAVKNAREARQY